jgi:hypothetical protein
MRNTINLKFAIVIPAAVALAAQIATAFEGRIDAVTVRGNETNALVYTVGTNVLRVEMTATNWPTPVDIVDLQSGALTLIFPHNRSFVRLKAGAENSLAVAPGMPSMPVSSGGLPPGIGPQAPATPAFSAMPARPSLPRPPGWLPPGVGPQAQVGLAAPGMAAMPMMHMMPAMPGEKLELRATGDKTNLLGLACQRYELKQHGETVEIWATEQLLSYRPYLQNQPHRFGPRRLNEQWPELLAERKLFPLLVRLHYDSGVERFRFEVKSITPDKIPEPGKNLFQPPPNYCEIQPLPF